MLGVAMSNTTYGSIVLIAEGFGFDSEVALCASPYAGNKAMTQIWLCEQAEQFASRFVVVSETVNGWTVEAKS